MDDLWHPERKSLGQGGNLHERLGVDLHAKSSQQRLLSRRGATAANLEMARGNLVSKPLAFRSATPRSIEPEIQAKDEERR
jgi:hypothetical protein